MWKRSSGEAEVKEKQGVSEELNSVETKFGSYYERPINLWFQKNLIVWKPTSSGNNQCNTRYVSEELNSVETLILLSIPFYITSVSEELNSVETGFAMMK